MKVINTIALILVIIGALNWGMVGFFKMDVISALFSEAVSRIIFGLVGLAGLWSFTFFKHFTCCSKNSSCK
jgi:uncharacterized protein